MPLRIVFCGTPDFAVPSLRHLIAQPDFEIVERSYAAGPPRGRGQQVSVSPVKAAAIEAGIPVYQPEKIKSPDSLDYFKRLAARRGGDYRLRADYFRAPDCNSPPRLDQSARLAAAEISRRGADQLGDCE